MGKKAKVRDLSRREPDGEQIAAALELLTSKDSADATVALLGAAYVDNGLRRAILHELKNKGRQRELFDGESAPFVTFAAKIKVAHAMGIIDDEDRKRLELIRHIRNAVAHAIWAVTFDTPEVADELDSMNLENWVMVRDESFNRRQTYGALCFWYWLRFIAHGIDFKAIGVAVREFVEKMNMVFDGMQKFADEVNASISQYQTKALAGSQGESTGSGD
ncbi:MAG TPA: DUF4145 domain-containing protein [Caulobacteraceae bacterium]|jgi:hypothetical protein|nr:DUF4145 domain-containing protein [Caulobacteraceae bacterium]